MSRIYPLKVLACLSLLCWGAAAAQTYPARPIRLIAGSSAGSASDIVCRIVGQKVTAQIGQQVIVDPRAGAGGNLAAEIAAAALPDGYTLLMGAPVHVINTSLYSNLQYNVLRDFAPVNLVTTTDYIFATAPSLPVKSMKELIALAKAKPGQLNFASSGIGNATHLVGELLNSMAGINIVHVPYKGAGPALTDLMAGHVQVMVGNLTAVLPLVRSGRIRALAVTGEKRPKAAPEIPTVDESGVKGYVATSWFGVLAPIKTPKPIVARLNAELKAATASAEVQKELLSLGSNPESMTTDQFGAFLKSETAKWQDVIRKAKIEL